MLSDRDIMEAHGDSILIEPFVVSNLQPASVDLRLGKSLLVHKQSSKPLDPMDPDNSNVEHVMLLGKRDTHLICPGDFIIGTTVERVTLGNGIVGRLEGKSSLARIGLVPHVAAGFIDPGFSGRITLELKNMGARPIILRFGMFIGQICFVKLESECNIPYGSEACRSRYQGQETATLSKGISSS